MRQLWINGARMDSIPLLRQAFAQADRDLRLEFGLQLTDQGRSGALGSWLSHQPELDVLTSEALELCRLRDSLSAGEVPEAALLSLLTGAPEHCFQACRVSPASSMQEEKRSLLKAMAWWPQGATRLETASDWTYVVVSREQLTQALRKHRESQAYSGEGANTIFLCNAGAEFWLDLREHNRDLRFVGLGMPKVTVDPRQFRPHIDLNAQNLYFEDFDLVVPSATQASGLEGRLKNARLIR